VSATLKLPEDHQRGLQFSVGDYVCIRFLNFPSSSSEESSSSHNNILLHARVTHVTEDNDQRPATKGHTLQLVEPSNAVSAEILKNKAHLYAVECIPQSQRYRVMIQAVKKLNKVSEAIRSVVLHQDLPSTPQKMKMSTLKGFPLDIDQAEAVKAALSLPLTVIHGQPGRIHTYFKGT
jgi:hypothetical protein